MMRVLGFLLLLLCCVVDSTVYVPGYPKLPKCGCNFNLTVIGNVRNSDGNGIPDVPVVVGGNRRATTDNEGFYRMHVDNSGRIPIRFEAGPPFTPVTRILNIAEDYRGEVRFDVVLVKGKKQTIDATKRNVIELPLGTAANNATFDIPANTFRNPKTGQVVDNVVATLTAWRPDNDDDAETVPGDFCSIDENGNKLALLTLGVFRLTFQEQSGERVQIANGCFVSFRARQYQQGLGPPILWTFNDETGLWEVNAPFTVNGLSFEAQVQPTVNSNLFNIDYAFPTCYMKVETYEDDSFIRRVAGVRIRFNQFIEGSEAWVFSNAATTGKDGVCMRVMCLKGPNLILRGTITATEGKQPRFLAATALNNDLPDEFDQTLDYTLEGDYTINSRIQECCQRHQGPVYSTLDTCRAGVSNRRYLFFREKGIQT